MPPCESAADQTQVSYKLTVGSWSSGTILSSNSTGVVYSGPVLQPGTAYNWTVQTTLSSCTSDVSEPATFITAHFNGWAAGAAYIWTAAAPDVGKIEVPASIPAYMGVAGDGPPPTSDVDGPPKPSGTMFGFFRKVVTVPAGKQVLHATAAITAVTDDVILCGYKLYIGGTLINVGPGRGEAAVWNGDGEYAANPYQMLDVTPSFAGGSGGVLVAVQSVGGSSKGVGRGLLVQLDLVLSDGTTMTTVTDNTWSDFNADAYFQPRPGRNWYAHVLEYTDASQEQVGWRDSLSFSGGKAWTPAVVGAAAAETPGLKPKMSRPLHVDYTMHPASSVKMEKINSTAFFFDFGKELQGGLIFKTSSGNAGQTFQIDAGESRRYTSPKNKTNKGPVTDFVDNDWGYFFNWTMRAGEQTIEQHQYMEFRYVNIYFDSAPPVDFNLSAWQASYEWNDEDSSFTCSNATLQAVWDLNKYTMKYAVLDTFIDSDTRERRPYEADGLVVSTARNWLQRDPMWNRHSVSYVVQFPTWPVEWVQISVLLAYQDYWATGQTDLMQAYDALLYNNTRYEDEDATGLLACNAQVSKGCESRPGKGHHIIDWLPGPSGSMFKGSNHTSVNNAFALNGLKLLAELSGLYGSPNAAVYAAKAAALEAAMQAKMWSANNSMWCDGACADVQGKSGVTTAAWTLLNNVVPKSSIETAWNILASHGAEGFGDYGVFVYLSALNKHAGDDGTAMVNALAKCDAMSWCAMIEKSNATMTRETWNSGTYSHAWGSGAITGAAGGILGVEQTAPAFANFTVKPRIGAMERAAGRVPTLMGYIDVAANKTHTDAAVPCNTVAKICVLHRAPSIAAAQAQRVVLDGKVITPETIIGQTTYTYAVEVDKLHVCVANVGCGSGGKVRLVFIELD